MAAPSSPSNELTRPLAAGGGRGSSAPPSCNTRTRPTPRARCSDQRLKHRDSWNTSEIKIEELVLAYDRDGSGLLEQDEFRELLQEFNDGRRPSEQEVSMIMRLADTNHNGSISQSELHYALRAWHSYRTMDDTALRLFSEFDVDESGRLDFQELKDLLTTLNAGMPVSLSEVQWVLDIGDANGDGRLDRSELLGAIAAWYVHVDRRGSGIKELVHEALARTAKDSDHGNALRAASRDLVQAVALVRDGSGGGYAEVSNVPAPAGGSSMAGQANGSAAPASSPGGEPETTGETRTRKLLVFVGRALGKFCYVFFPFWFGGLLAMIGWETRDSNCPRNLDGIQVWFGLVAVAFGIVVYLSGQKWARDLKITLGVVLLVLNFVGLAWAYDGRVLLEKEACGPKLVTWSRFLWPTVPVIAAGVALYRCVTYTLHLRGHDERIQKECV